MLKSLSYINIALALVYFMFYLLNSYSWAILAILLVILYNGLVIRNMEKDIQFTATYYLLGGLCLIFSGFLIIWVFNIVVSALALNYLGDALMYLILTPLFIVCILWQYLLVIKTWFSKTPR